MSFVKINVNGAGQFEGTPKRDWQELVFLSAWRRGAVEYFLLYLYSLVCQKFFVEASFFMLLLFVEMCEEVIYG